MTDRSQLPFLLDLLEDESEEIQKAVIKKLASFGPCLEDELRSSYGKFDEAKIRIALYMVEDYLRELKGLSERKMPRQNSDRPTMFSVGQVVNHKRYGYRALVVDFDLVCQADEVWYEANIVPPPSKNQPWYYLFVHLVNRVTYAAQSSLKEDDSEDKIVHPLLNMFFTDYENGLYKRNTKPWPRLGSGDPPKG